MEDEENKMDVLTAELKDFVCNNLCERNVCNGCDLQKYIQDILNEYNRLNTFDNTQTAAVMKKYSGIVLCNECICRGEDSKRAWCKVTATFILSDNDGCSSGVRREANG